MNPAACVIGEAGDDVSDGVDAPTLRHHRARMVALEPFVSGTSMAKLDGSKNLVDRQLF